MAGIKPAMTAEGSARKIESSRSAVIQLRQSRACEPPFKKILFWIVIENAL